MRICLLVLLLYSRPDFLHYLGLLLYLRILIDKTLSVSSN